MATARAEEYLEAIYKLQEEADKPVSISKVAEYLKLSPASASEMVKRLKQNGTVNYSQTRAISLTKEGLRQASRVIRRHRLAERLLTDFLKLDWHEVHDEACKLEHVIGPEVEERLAKSLGNPATCPHGYPIPNTAGEYPKVKLIPLLDLNAGDDAVVVRVREDQPEMLKYLADLGLRPTIKIKLLEVAPFGGPVTVKVGEKKHVVGRELAGVIKVIKR